MLILILKLKEYVDRVITKIAAAQEEDGYLHTQRTINSSKVQQGAGEKLLDHMIHNHELYNVGHMYEAAVAY